MTEPTDYKARLAQLKAANEEKGYSFSKPAQPVTAPPLVGPASGGAAGAAQPVPDKGTLDDGAKAELRTLDLLTIYQRWFNPQSVRQGGGDEVNVSCFNTDFHRGGDSNPQLGFNTVKNTYYCHACNVTGDIVDLTAVKYGFANSQWQCDDKDVHEAVRYAGEELLGMQFRKTAAGYQRIPEYRPLEVARPSPAVAQSSPPVAQNWSNQTTIAPAPGTIVPGRLTLGTFAPGGPAAQPLTLGSFGVPDAVLIKPNVAAFPAPPAYDPPEVEIAPEDDDAEDEIAKNLAKIGLNWRDFVPHGTPLHNYMEIVCTDDTPEEFHFWNFMSLIGLAMGRKVFLPDAKPVYGNMLLCIIGRTGQGKSRSEGFINELIRSAMPFNEDDHLTNGVRIVKNPGSGEFLANVFNHQVPDPTIPATKTRGKPNVLVNPAVKALIRYPEMATMISKGASKGSTVKDTVIDLYDTPDAIGGGSLTHGSYGAKNPFGSVTTTTQLSAIRNLVTKEDAGSGFLNRWWFVVGREKQYQSWGTYVDISPLNHDVHMLVKWVEDKYRSVRGIHTLSKDAYELANEFLHTRCRPLEKDPDSDMMRRATLTFKKLILLFSANLMEDEVSVSAVEQAQIVFEYLVQCMRNIGAQISQTDYEKADENVVSMIMRNGQDGMTPRDLRQALKRRLKISLEQVNAHIKALEAQGTIEMRLVPQPAGRVGRPKSRYFLRDD